MVGDVFLHLRLDLAKAFELLHEVVQRQVLPLRRTAGEQGRVSDLRRIAGRDVLDGVAAFAGDGLRRFRVGQDFREDVVPGRTRMRRLNGQAGQEVLVLACGSRAQRRVGLLKILRESTRLSPQPVKSFGPSAADLERSSRIRAHLGCDAGSPRHEQGEQQGREANGARHVGAGS